MTAISSETIMTVIANIEGGKYNHASLSDSVVIVSQEHYAVLIDAYTKFMENKVIMNGFGGDLFAIPSSMADDFARDLEQLGTAARWRRKDNIFDDDTDKEFDMKYGQYLI